MAERRETYRNVRGKPYRFLWAPEHPTAYSHGYALEHRMVAYDAGMIDPAKPKDRRVQVRHLNGDTLDNRVENLVVGTLKELACELGSRNQHGSFDCRADCCAVESCDRPAYRGDLCGIHDRRFRVTGDPLGVRRLPTDRSEPYRLVPFHTPPVGPACSLDGCGRMVESLGLCSAHVRRLRRFGDPLTVRRVTRTTATPYRLVTDEGVLQ